MEQVDPSELFRYRFCPMIDEAWYSKDFRSTRKKETHLISSELGTLGPVGPLIRTGCISCLQDSVKCNGSNPRCQIEYQSEDWRLNSDATWQWHGTWRERHGLHVFIHFATSPERASLFESPFWHRTVMLACFNNEAVYHAACAVGSLHEHIIKQAVGGDSFDKEGISFALNECNRSIALLTAATDDDDYDRQRVTCRDPGIILITCALFACFESLQGDFTQAIGHFLQGQKLLRNCEQLAALGRGSRIVDPATARPVIGGLELQAKSLQGKTMQRSDTSCDPPLPNIDWIHSLEHAHSTLHYAYVYLIKSSQDCYLDTDASMFASRMADRYDTFVPWLKKWEKNFADFLFRESTKISPRDMQRAKILKANHLTATMTAKLDPSQGMEAWRQYDNECKAVVDLCASILKTFKIPSDTKVSSFQYPSWTFGLWVAEPLFTVMARCGNPNTRRQAIGLLSGLRKADRAHQLKVREAPTFQFQPPIEQPADTDSWSNEQWIKFGMRSRIDVGMATYFTRLPSDYISTLGRELLS